MFPFFLLLIIPFCMMFIGIEKKERHHTLLIGSGDEIAQTNLALPLFFIVLLLLLVFRADTIGRDLPSYKIIFSTYGRMPWRTLFKQTVFWDGQILFCILTKIIYLIKNDFHLYISIFAVLTLIPMAIYYCEDRTFSLLKIVIFLEVPTFIMLFSGIRQSLAIAVGILAYFEVRKKRPIRFLIWCVIAILIHHSAFMILPFYFLYHLKIEKKHLLIVIPIMVLVFVFNEEIFKTLTLFLGEFSNNYEGEISNTGAFGSLILYILFAVVSFVVTDKEKMEGNNEAYGLRNFLLMAVALQCFAPLHSLAMRLNYYYIIFIPVAFAKSLKCAKVKYRQVVILMEIVIILVFAFLFIRSVYIGSTTGISTLDTYPYVPLWKE